MIVGIIILFVPYTSAPEIYKYVNTRHEIDENGCVLDPRNFRETCTIGYAYARSIVDVTLYGQLMDLLFNQSLTKTMYVFYSHGDSASTQIRNPIYTLSKLGCKDLAIEEWFTYFARVDGGLQAVSCSNYVDPTRLKNTLSYYVDLVHVATMRYGTEDLKHIGTRPQ